MLCFFFLTTCFSHCRACHTQYVGMGAIFTVPNNSDFPRRHGENFLISTILQCCHITLHYTHLLNLNAIRLNFFLKTSLPNQLLIQLKQSIELCAKLMEIDFFFSSGMSHIHINDTYSSEICCCGIVHFDGTCHDFSF